MDTNKLLCGITGTTLSAAGAAISVTEIQAIVSIIITVLGFIISILVPLIIKLINKIKAAKQDGKIDADEAKDICNDVKEIVDKTINEAKEIIEKTKADKK